MQDDELIRRFDNIDNRFDTVDTRFSAVDQRFDAVDARFSAVDGRFDRVDARLSEVNDRFGNMERLILEEGKRTRSHFDAVAEDLKDQLGVRISAVESRVSDVEKTQKVVLIEVRGLATKVNRLKPSSRPKRP